MCRAAIENGGIPLRCNKHNAFGQQLTNLQARKQYTIRKLGTSDLTETQREKLENSLQTTRTEIAELQTEKENLGTGLTPYTMTLVPECETVLTTLENAGLKPYIVGGSVRDALLGLDQKDIDIEVYGGDTKTIIKALKQIGQVDEVGQAFGVLKITLNGEDFDISLPRKDSKTGDGHTGFEVEVDPNLTLDEATARRDYTINALMYNHKLGYIIDKHSGIEDIANKKLRHVSDAFDEDPLRVLRGVQMASRFGFQLHPDTIEKARTLKDGYNQLATERVRIEFQKLYEKGHYPHEALKLLKATEWDENLPGLQKANTPQLWKETEEVQKTFTKFNIPATDRPKIVGAVITKHIEPSEQLAFLKETMVGETAKNAAYNLANATPPKVTTDQTLREWAYRLPRNVSIRDWVHTEYASGDRKNAEQIYAHARKLNLLDTIEKDMVNGNEIMETLDRQPGRWMKPLMDKMRDAQYSGKFRTNQDGIKYLKANLNILLDD